MLKKGKMNLEDIIANFQWVFSCFILLEDRNLNLEMGLDQNPP
jgi:hypothetical protein